MKASEAKLLVSKHEQIRETLNTELKLIYSDIKHSALRGVVAYHYHRGWLGSNRTDDVYITQTLISTLKGDGYAVEEKYSNPNKPWILISWL